MQMSSRLRVVAGIAAFVAAAALDDAAALLQGPPGTVNLASVGHHAIVNSEDGASAELGEQTGNQDDMQIQAAPVVEVESGRVKGYHDKGFDVFKSIPFAEPPARFQPPGPRTRSTRGSSAPSASAPARGPRSRRTASR